MQLKLISSEKLKVTLEAKDMAEMKVAYNELECDNFKTKKLVFSLLSKAKIECGFNHKNSKLLIEAFPETKGGCVLYFTLVDQKANEITAQTIFSSKNNSSDLNRFVLTNSDITIYKTDNFDLILLSSKALSSIFNSDILKTKLFKIKDNYFLTIITKKDKNKIIKGILSEFGLAFSCNKKYLFYLQEHGNEIISAKAVEILAVL